jgi:predicted nucleic acid-binding protein
LPPLSEWPVPTIVQLELAKWARRESPAEKAEQLIAFTTTCVVAALTTEIALFAAEICDRRKLATADAIIYATALTFEADLLTRDGHFENLPGVCYLPKMAA